MLGHKFSRAYFVSIVRPVGRFTPKAGAVPKKWELIRTERDGFDEDYCDRYVQKYNASVLRHGWSTWAVLCCDPKRDRLPSACLKAQVTVPRYLSDGRRRSSDAGLSTHPMSLYRNPKDDAFVKVVLECGWLPITGNETADEIRALAIAYVEQTLAEVKAKAGEPKPRRKRKAA